MRKLLSAIILGAVLLCGGAQSRAEGGKLYVTLFGDAGISVVDPETLDAWGTINTEEGPAMMKASKDGKLVFVTTGHEDKVQVIDAGQDKALKSIKVGKGAFGLDITPDGKLLLVCCFEDHGIYVIDTAALEVTKRLAVPSSPTDIKVSPDGKKAYVATPDDRLFVVDIGGMKVVPGPDAGHDVYSLEVSRSGDRLYVYSQEDGAINVLDTSSMKKVNTIKADHKSGLRLSRDGKELWFNGPGASVNVYSVAKGEVVASVPRDSETSYCNFEFSPDGKQVYVVPGGEEQGSVYVFDAARKVNVGKISLKSNPRDVLYVPK